MSSADWPDGAAFNVLCLGCQREFAGLRDYSAHDCPQPRSGEVFK